MSPKSVASYRTPTTAASTAVVVPLKIFKTCLVDSSDSWDPTSRNASSFAAPSAFPYTDAILASCLDQYSAATAAGVLDKRDDTAASSCTGGLTDDERLDLSRAWQFAEAGTIMFGSVIGLSILGAGVSFLCG